MSDSTEGDASKLNAAAMGGGGLAPEDAERFAATFVPSWQFDPNAAADSANPSSGQFGGLSASEIERLSNPVVAAPSMLAAPPTDLPQAHGFDNALTTADVDVSALAPRPSPAVTEAAPVAAVRQTLLMHGAPVAAQPSAEEPPREQAVARPQPPPSRPPPSVPSRKTRSARPEPLAEAVARAVPQSARPRVERVSRTEDTGRIPIKKSSLSGIGGVVVGGAVGLLILAGIVGSRALSGKEPAASVAPAPPPPPRVAEMAVPPPPPAEAPAAPTPPANDTHVKPSTVAIAAPPPPPPPPAPPPPQAAAQPAAKPPAQAWHPPPRPAPKNPTKPGGGGIVRDNPF